MPQEEFDLVAPVVRDSLLWGGTEPTTGEWTREPSLDVIRFENVRTMGEYLELASVQPQEVGVLGQQHIALLGEVYTQWCRGGEWPGSREFIVGYRGKGDALRLLKEIPTRYRSEVQWSSIESKRFSLTLDGIAFSGRADADLTAFVAMVHVLVEQLESSPEDARITIPELARRASVLEPTASRMAEVMAHDWALGVSLGHDDSRSTMRVRDTILTYEGIRTFEDFLSRREDRARSNKMRENDEVDDAAIRKGILEMFAELPEDASRHLNRSNVLGRPTQPGGLEHHLNHTFTIEERGRADRLMRQLESEGLLAPTWSDMVAPPDWLIITSPGREVLREGLAPRRESVAPARSQDQEFDAFLCHASEDKTAVVTPFASLMEKHGLKPWWDAGQIGWGDSLIRTIERGLTQSRFVIVFISETSLRKTWPEKELRAALNLEVSGSKKVLPVIMGIDHASLENNHPFLAEKRYLTIQPYDPSREVAAEDLHHLLDALKAELSRLRE